MEQSAHGKTTTVNFMPRGIIGRLLVTLPALPTKKTDDCHEKMKAYVFEEQFSGKCTRRHCNRHYEMSPDTSGILASFVPNRTAQTDKTYLQYIQLITTSPPVAPRNVETGEPEGDSVTVPLLDTSSPENVLAPTRPVGWLQSFRPPPGPRRKLFEYRMRIETVSHRSNEWKSNGDEPQVAAGTSQPGPYIISSRSGPYITETLGYGIKANSEYAMCRKNMNEFVSPPPRLPLPRPPNPTVLKLTMPTQPRTSEGSSPGSTPSPPTTSVSGPGPRRWRRDDRMQRRLNTELLEAIEDRDDEEVERVLNEGANPNATCRVDLVSACHMAALSGGECLSHLLKRGADRHRLDKLGRTPLHLAAWAGHARQLAELLDFPEEMCLRLQDEDMSSDAEEDVRKMCARTSLLANMPCQLGEVKIALPKEWKDNLDHNCLDIKGSVRL
ncbi:Uveal autoantigen with coiled-coil domains and ankyrin repeats [Eumeta japonica]|uniref:Uveal autoantigen with coiled-coil domains and ankyrin repeats n=1 Tax=Eumeta variegata TaxID=151549 RepID=A0A4C1XSM4_EUMVA|nr:Uveal autoantigen with coiled-coil domains and ankyrin repeats [Eumeta japonica]